MTDSETRLKVRDLIVKSGRPLPLAQKMAEAMTKRELSEGVVFVNRWLTLETQIVDWLVTCGDRMLQDQADAET